MTAEQEELIIGALVEFGPTHYPWADPIYAVGKSLGLNPDDVTKIVVDIQHGGQIVLTTSGTDRTKNREAPASDWWWERAMVD